MTKPSIVLVHGAFADASCWKHVIPRLERQGYFVTAVQNPQTSFEDDVATTKRMIDAQNGPVVVVGHSYGGAVMTGAAAGNAKVVGLMYVAAFAPDAGESMSVLLQKYPSPLVAALRPDTAGFLYVDRSVFRDVFAADVSPEEARVMAATQKPISDKIFTATVATPAWKAIPSWYLVASNDQAILPELQRFYAKRMGARTTEIKASHVPFLSHSKEVAMFIDRSITADNNRPAASATR